MLVFSAVRTVSGLVALASLTLFFPTEDLRAQPKAEPQSPAAAVAENAPGQLETNATEVGWQRETFSAAMAKHTRAGFRLGGAPELEYVFGDIDVFKRKLDAFDDLHEKMRAERLRFATASHSAQQLLARPRVKGQPRTCPAEQVAPNYAIASRASILYQHLGGELERAYFAIRQLDELGESSGLTPDYRRKVKKSRRRYRRAVTDLREMRTVFHSELRAGLRSRGCQSAKLLALASTLAADKTRASTPDSKVQPATKVGTDASPTISASTATFFVSNESCGDALAVHVDGTHLGNVAPGKKAAFQSLMGRHSLCLLGTDSELSCGETSTIRTAFFYDGFSVSRYCEAH